MLAALVVIIGLVTQRNYALYLSWGEFGHKSLRKKHRVNLYRKTPLFHTGKIANAEQGVFAKIWWRVFQK